MSGITILAEGAIDINYFDVLVVKGGLIGWLLWVINFLTWVLVIKFLVEIRRETIMPELSRGQIEELFEAKQYRDVLEITEDDPSYLAYIVHSSLAQPTMATLPWSGLWKRPAKSGRARCCETSNG